MNNLLKTYCFDFQNSNLAWSEQQKASYPCYEALSKYY